MGRPALNEIRFNSRLLQAITSLPPLRHVGLETCSLGQGGGIAPSDRRANTVSGATATKLMAGRPQPTSEPTSSFTPGPMVDAIDTFLM
jgi:hypothetical protein